MNSSTKKIILIISIGFILLFNTSILIYDILFEEDEPVNQFMCGILSNPICFDPLGADDNISKDVILNTLEGLYAFDYLSEKVLV